MTASIGSRPSSSTSPSKRGCTFESRVCTANKIATRSWPSSPRRRIAPLEPAGELDASTVLRCERIVGLMGHEPIADAIERGADVILTGRATDTALIAALPLLPRLSCRSDMACGEDRRVRRLLHHQPAFWRCARQHRQHRFHRRTARPSHRLYAHLGRGAHALRERRPVPHARTNGHARHLARRLHRDRSPDRAGRRIDLRTGHAHHEARRCRPRRLPDHRHRRDPRPRHPRRHRHMARHPERLPHRRHRQRARPFIGPVHARVALLRPQRRSRPARTRDRPTTRGWRRVSSRPPTRTSPTRSPSTRTPTCSTCRCRQWTTSRASRSCRRPQRCRKARSTSSCCNTRWSSMRRTTWFATMS